MEFTTLKEELVELMNREDIELNEIQERALRYLILTAHYNSIQSYHNIINVLEIILGIDVTNILIKIFNLSDRDVETIISENEFDQFKSKFENEIKFENES